MFGELEDNRKPTLPTCVTICTLDKLPASSAKVATSITLHPWNELTLPSNYLSFGMVIPFFLATG